MFLTVRPYTNHAENLRGLSLSLLSSFWLSGCVTSNELSMLAAEWLRMSESVSMQDRLLRSEQEYELASDCVYPVDAEAVPRAVGLLGDSPSRSVSSEIALTLLGPQGKLRFTEVAGAPTLEPYLVRGLSMTPGYFTVYVSRDVLWVEHYGGGRGEGDLMPQPVIVLLTRPPRRVITRVIRED